MFSLCACNLKQVFSPDEIHKKVSFESGGITIAGILDYAVAEEMTYTVKEPENISGTVFTSDEISLGEIRIGYGKMKSNSPVHTLFVILSDLLSKEVEIPLKGEYAYEGAVSSTEYKIIFNCENREIKSIETGKITYIFE